MPSAPNTLGRATTYEELHGARRAGGLGDDLVVQTPYGDSGKTTFFIRGERDWDRYAEDIVDEELKVMKRINCRAAAVEAVHHPPRHDRRPADDRPHRLSRS